MPEGDTIARTAATLRRWLLGHQITAARSVRIPIARVIGETVEAVDTDAKHLLIRFGSGYVLHTHMRMTGSWHVYRQGDRWRAPSSQARVVLEAGDRIAVCFNAPVVELIDSRAVGLHPVLSELGPDILATPIDVAEMRRRARACAAETPMGGVLLDQRVVGGIGNIWRSETLFLTRIHPADPVASVDDDAWELIITTAARVMHASVAGGPREPRWVYRRTGRPCRRCGALIAAGPIGAGGRTAYWCPRCQPAATP